MQDLGKWKEKYPYSCFLTDRSKDLKERKPKSARSVEFPNELLTWEE
jgi:hypothetical protein